MSARVSRRALWARVRWPHFMRPSVSASCLKTSAIVRASRPRRRRIAVAKTSGTIKNEEVRGVVVVCGWADKAGRWGRRREYFFCRPPASCRAKINCVFPAPPGEVVNVVCVVVWVVCRSSSLKLATERSSLRDWKGVWAVFEQKASTSYQHALASEKKEQWVAASSANRCDTYIWIAGVGSSGKKKREIKLSSPNRIRCAIGLVFGWCQWPLCRQSGLRERGGSRGRFDAFGFAVVNINGMIFFFQRAARAVRVGLLLFGVVIGRLPAVLVGGI